MPTPTAVPFDSLPLRKDGPHGNAWGLFGDGNLLGMLNLLTPKTTASAAKEIVDGVRISTDLTLDRMKVPCFGRAGLSHTIRNKAPRSVNDDSLSFNTQISSQWDGFRHYGYQEEQLYYGGHVLNDLLSSDVIGIQGKQETIRHDTEAKHLNMTDDNVYSSNSMGQERRHCRPRCSARLRSMGYQTRPHTSRIRDNRYCRRNSQVCCQIPRN